MLAAHWWCTRRPLLTGWKKGWRVAMVALLLLAEAGHRAILSAIETGTSWRENWPVDGGFRPGQETQTLT